MRPAVVAILCRKWDIFFLTLHAIAGFPEALIFSDMNFVFPGFLFALLAVAIPVVIHLFHFRRYKKVFFSNVSFLKQLSDESKKQSRLKHLLVLASRILAVVFLVMAFARPYIPVEDTFINLEGNAVSVYIDNSFSMEALAQRGSLLQEAREKARQIAGMYQPADQFQLLTNDFEGRHQRFVTREEFTAMLGQVEVSPAFRTVGGVMTRQGSLLRETPLESKRAYLISDFQKSNTLFDDMETDTLVSTIFIPLSAQQTDNLFIDSCWFESPIHLYGQTKTLFVRIVNDSDRSLTGQPVRLFLDDVQRTIASYDVGPRAAAEVSLSWTINTTGLQHGRIEIVDFPVTFDDRMYFSYWVNDEIPVLAVNEGSPGPFLNALFGTDSIFRFEQMPAFSIDYSRFPGFNLIILNGLNTISAGLAFELQNFLEQGGTLLVFPGSAIDYSSYADFLAGIGADPYVRADTTQTRVGMLNDLHPVYTGVFENIPENIDLPQVTKHYVIARQLTSVSQNLMQLQSGAPFLTAQPVNNGQLFLSAVPLNSDFSNFPRHALFVPTLVNIALQSQPFQNLYHVLGQNHQLSVKGVQGRGEAILSLRGMGMEIIPEQRRTGNRWQLFFHDQIREAGNYVLYAGDMPVKGLSFNYDRRESELGAHSMAELSNALSDAGIGNVSLLDTGGADFELALQEMRVGRQLWRHFLMLALLFLLVEVALLRFW